uniref:NB-ARC domain-containing protein n=1 Tax=Oryza barthii TaxID=65489 RepID=A0A0D3FSS2_9ORYZ
MWIADGFIPGDENSKLPEVLGQEYYTELVTRNLLEPIDGNFDESRWAMHSVFHSFAQYLAKEEALLLREGQNTSNLSQRFRRISVSRKEVEYSDIQKQKSLRALVSFGSINLKSGDSLGALPYLRILHVNNTEISTLLGSLYHLKLLKYLDLSNTDVSSLPCNIGKMKCLQYICVHGCQKLKQLHKSIVNLHKLRFLDISDTSVKTVPKGFGRLINLVSLKGFPTHTDDNGKCTLEELEPLSKLMHLTVWGLQNISSNCSSTGAKLSDKTHLTSLWLRCTTTEGNELQSQEVFDDLCPSPSLEHLTITGYFGCRLPKWLMSMVLDNLRMLKLENLQSCTELPYSLGQLPNLESLCVQHARRISYIGEEFFRPSTLGDDSESDQDERSIRTLVEQYNRSMAVSTAFPKLIKLVFYGLLGWKEWDWELKLEAMRALQNLQISRCRLSHLPPGLAFHAVALRVMTIERVMELRSVENFGSVVELYLHSNSNLEKIANLPKMEMLRISKCPKLKVLEEVEALSSMELKDYEMRTLPEYLKSLELRQLKIDCTLKLLHMISQRDAALEWEKISHIENIEAYADGFDDNKRLHVFYTKETDSFKIHLGEYGAHSNSTDTEDIDAAAGQLEQEDNHEEHVTVSELPTSEQSTHGS